MTNLVAIAAFVALFMPLSLTLNPTARADSEAHHHGQAQFSAGEPGDPDKEARVIEIIVRESAGKMLFVPELLETRGGEQIRFVLRNEGELDHEFVLATTEENLEHAEEMREHPEMRHHDPNAISVAPKQTNELLWKFTKKGRFEFACLIPGHRESGMFGVINVK